MQMHDAIHYHNHDSIKSFNIERVSECNAGHPFHVNLHSLVLDVKLVSYQMAGEIFSSVLI